MVEYVIWYGDGLDHQRFFGMHLVGDEREIHDAIIGA